MAEESFAKVGHLKDVAAFRQHVASLGVDLPCDEQIMSAAQGSPLGQPLDVGGFVVGNRWCIHPMEGWDGTTTGEPTEFTLRRWEHFGALTIQIPPLRERKGDLPVLTDLFVEQFAREHVRGVRGVSSPAMDMLMNYDWPGNVAQLRTTIERAVVLTSGPVIHHHHLPAEMQASGEASAPMPRHSPPPSNASRSSASRRPARAATRITTTSRVEAT